MPEYYWYKENEYMRVSGTFTKEDTIVTTHNLTEEELVKLPDITNFSFQNRKQLSIGKTRMNLHPVDSLSSKISGHTMPFASVLIKMSDKEEIVEADTDGMFTLDLTEEVKENTIIEIISCVPNSFIYTTRKISVPYDGELNIMEVDNNIVFSLTPILFSPVILPKIKEIVLKIVDSRVTKTSFKIYVSLEKEITSENGFTLEGAIIFKTFDEQIFTLNENETLIYTNEEDLENKDVNGEVNIYNLTYSTDKGVLLSLANNALEVNEEYMTSVFWKIECQ